MAKTSLQSLYNAMANLRVWPRWARMLLLALFAATLWWLLALLIRGQVSGLEVWGDQRWTFLDPRGLSQPYAVAGFVNPPWAHVLLAPFKWLPVELAVLGQMWLYFGLLAGLVLKFAPTDRLAQPMLALLVVVTSPLALDTALEINIDWIVALGLLLPAAWSGPFILTKPQNALGYVLSLTRRGFLRWLIVVLLTVLASLLIWGAWPLDLLANAQRYPVSLTINVAPSALLGYPAALVLGVVGLLWLFRRHVRAAYRWLRSGVLSSPPPPDPVWCVLVGLCFVPYLAGYSAFVPFALWVARRPVWGGVVSGGLWLAVAAIFIRL